MRRFTIIYLSLQALGCAAWWLMLLAVPPSRHAFMARGAPDATVLAFGFADALLFTSASALAAYGLSTRRAWAWPMLLVHVGAAAYASLYCWTLFALTGDAWLAALLMSPSLVVPGYCAWRQRPRSNEGRSC